MGKSCTLVLIMSFEHISLKGRLGTQPHISDAAGDVIPAGDFQSE